MILYETFYNNAVSLTLKSTYFLEVYKNSKNLSVTGIAVDGKGKILIGDKVPIIIQAGLIPPYNTYYIANWIYPETRRAVINEFEENDTTLFVLPLLGVPSKLLLLPANFINGYIATKSNYNELGDCVYVIYRYMPFPQYTNLMRILSNQENFISKEKAEDKRFDILKFNIPDRFKESVKLIFKGGYSKIPNHVKHTITKFKNRKTDDIIYQTLFNSDKLRKNLADNLEVRIEDLPDELREKPRLIKETWEK